MKTKTTKLFYCVLIAISFVVAKAEAQMVFIPDTNFRNWIDATYPGAIVGDSLDTTNALVVNDTSVQCSYAGVSDFTGIQYFVNAIWFQATNNTLTAFPPIPPQARFVYVMNNSISVITSVPSYVTILNVSSNPLSSLNGLPLGLKMLSCDYCVLNSLPTLPDSLTQLSCAGNALTTLPAFPPELFWVNCGQNQLTSFTSFNQSLVSLDCQGNNLTTLPALPNSLEYLYCNNNTLDSLPALPDSLKQLHCINNNLTGLPTLPSLLHSLICDYNSISVLPSLPDSLSDLSCSNNNLTSLPWLTPNIVILDVKDNFISCLPYLPAGLLSLHSSGNGITCLPNLPSTGFNSDIGYMICPIHYSACDTFPVIKGKVFYDINNNGVFDATETLMQQRMVSLSPNVWNGLTDTVGEFTAVVDTGNYQINVFTYKYDYVTTPIQTASLPNYFDVDTDNVIGLYMPPNINDLEVHLVSVNPPRPGFHNQINIEYSNTGSTTLTGSVNFTFDNNYVFDSAAPPQFSQAGNLLTWNFSNLPPYATVTIKTYFYLPATVPIGTILTNTVTVYPLNNDSTPADNRDTLIQTVVGSYDPNDKSVEPSGIVTYITNPVNDTLKYTIRFQNTGTYLAENVTLIDTLDARLNPATFHLISSSHPCNVQIYGNLLSFTFNNINLPDSNADEINSHGYVQFTINIDSSANLTTPIINRADIYFDFNPPVRTPDAMVQYVDISGIENYDGNSTVTLYPNPVNDVLYVSLNNHLPANTIITINDMQGRVVKEEKISKSNSSVIPINVSALSQGVYLLKLNGQVQRFVKM